MGGKASGSVQNKKHSWKTGRLEHFSNLSQNRLKYTLKKKKIKIDFMQEKFHVSLLNSLCIQFCHKSKIKFLKLDGNSAAILVLTIRL